ncbi:unnamed protein product, partial [Meganyctiphanes norvegica]
MKKELEDSQKLKNEDVEVKIKEEIKAKKERLSRLYVKMLVKKVIKIEINENKEQIPLCEIKVKYDLLSHKEMVTSTGKNYLVKHQKTYQCMYCDNAFRQNYHL